MATGMSEDTIRELIRTPKYLVKAIVKSPLRVYPPLWNNTYFVAYSDEDLFDYILKEQPADFIVYGLLREETRNTSEWSIAATLYNEQRERERDEKEYERLKKDLGKE
jgi:hypothetical protein